MKRETLPYERALAAELDELMKKRMRPPTDEERAQRRESLEAMDRLRARVGRDFDAAKALREIRGKQSARESSSGHGG